VWTLDWTGETLKRDAEFIIRADASTTLQCKHMQTDSLRHIVYPLSLSLRVQPYCLSVSYTTLRGTHAYSTSWPLRKPSLDVEHWRFAPYESTRALHIQARASSRGIARQAVALAVLSLEQYWMRALAVSLSSRAVGGQLFEGGQRVRRLTMSLSWSSRSAQKVAGRSSCGGEGAARQRRWARPRARGAPGW